MTRTIAVAALLALGGCTSAQIATAQSVATQATGPVTTLAALAAKNSTTVASLLYKGVLFCAKADGTIQAVATATGMVAPVASLIPGGAVAVSVVGATEDAVKGVCAALQAIPVPVPTNVAPDSVPVVAVAAGASLKPAS